MENSIIVTYMEKTSDVNFGIVGFAKTNEEAKLLIQGFLAGCGYVHKEWDFKISEVGGETLVDVPSVDFIFKISNISK